MIYSRTILFILLVTKSLIRWTTTAFSLNQHQHSPFPFITRSSPSSPSQSQSHSQSIVRFSSLSATSTQYLEEFLSFCSECNQQKAESVQIISRASSNLPPHQAIKTAVFTTPTQESTIVTISKHADQIDESILSDALSIPVNSVPLDQMESICGFAPGSVPPLGHSSDQVKIAIDSSLIETCQSENLRIVAPAGHPSWQCLVSPDLLLSLPNAQVASFTNSDSDAVVDKRERPSPAPSLPSATSTPKPFFSAETPPLHISQLVVKQKELSNPLATSAVKVIGRLVSLNRKTKKLLTCDLLPPFSKSSSHDNVQEDSDDVDPLPWRSGSDCDDMAVNLIFGKALFQRLGAAQGEVALDTLQEGQLVEATTQTMVGNRDSLERWSTGRFLDLEVRDFRILASPNIHNDKERSPDTHSVSSNAGSFKHRPPSHNVGLPQLPALTMSDVYPDSGGEIQLVDSMESLILFADETLRLLSNLDNHSDNESEHLVNQTLPTTLLGIDCEWQPNQLSARGEPQPILLLQISFHILGKVFLLDLQALLRPLLSPDESMNDLEVVVSETLNLLFMSRRVLKTGYQVASDLRRIAASYPHVPCFQEVQAVLEVDSLVKRVLHLTKQKKSRSITMSLSRLTAHYLGKSVSKECQVSDWSGRPLSSEQIEYASLDAAISPIIAEKALESINASISGDRPRIERWYGDEGVSKAIDSWRFLFLESEDEKAIKKLQAKQIVGPAWIVTQSWVTEGKPPRIPSVPPRDGEGPYTDTNGVLRLPARMLSIKQPGGDAIFASLVGQQIGRSKDRCLGLVLVGQAALPQGARIDYPKRSGFVEFQDGIALFVSMSGKQGLGEPRSFPNGFLDDGKILSWFVSSNHWNDGNSELATKLLLSRAPDGDNMPLLLFVRMDNGNFLSCGRCRVLLLDDVPNVTDTNKPKDWGLIKLNLELLDYEKLILSEEFINIVGSK